MTDTSLLSYLAPTTERMPDADTLCRRREDLKQALLRLESAVMPEDVPAVTKLNDSFSDFGVNVSLVGQVKAGKTALANALLGQSDLLPSDVNPWTSVVTSTHINRVAPKGKKAIFQFFSSEDWDDLVSKSGRIVSLAKEAKLDTRVDELKAQIEELKARTEGRLGRNFKLLLGNQHAFSTFDAELIKRYVCLGEDDMLEERQGRFADLTKSADLFMDSADFPYPITLADTPGVNDPLLVREAATLDNLRNSDVYVVVLSAHQALSSVDLGLLRLLKSFQSNRLIVFINRVDELSDPQSQIEEIRGYVTEILGRQGIASDVPVIFGSASWADAALRGDFDNLPEDSVDSLKQLIANRTSTLSEDATDAENVANLLDVSGVSALRAAIHGKAWHEVFKPRMSRIASKADVLAERSMLYLSEFEEAKSEKRDPRKIESGLKLLKKAKGNVDLSFAQFESTAAGKLKMDMATAYTSFRTRETRTLQACLSKSSKLQDWVPDTDRLRNDLNGAYDEYSADTLAFLKDLNGKVAKALRSAYSAALGSADSMRTLPMQLPQVPMPVALMRTMNVDLRAANSLDWLRRKLDKSIYLDQFEAAISADSRLVIAEACKEGIADYLKQAAAAFRALIDTHVETLEGIVSTGSDDFENKIRQLMEQDRDFANRLQTLCDVSAVLQEMETGEEQEAASPKADVPALKEPA